MDPISNILCTIRNGISAKKTYVSVPYGKVGWAICHVLYLYGYIHGMGIQSFGKHKRIVVVLLPKNEYTSYTTFTRISSPKKRVYTSVHELRASMHSFHVRVLSTPKGIMADKDAIKENVGGEVLFICN
jgi:small subunit ribosomal protein S8|tara:strand:+ start:3629 stop:4015 length:387 start_codon:yes stop_codon:yes gene_type:complete